MSESNENQAVRERVIESSSSEEANPTEGINWIVDLVDEHGQYIIPNVYFSKEGSEAMSYLTKIRESLNDRVNMRDRLGNGIGPHWKKISKAARKIMAKYAGQIIVAEGYAVTPNGSTVMQARIKVYNSVEAVLNDYDGRTDLKKILAYQVGREDIWSLDNIFTAQREKNVNSAKRVEQPTPVQTHETMYQTTYTDKSQPVKLERKVLVAPGR